MPRPALSASRSLDVIDFLAAFPERSFTLTDIVRAAKINAASCHAVLSALTERGYLTRCSKTKSYTLGPVLAAVGQAAMHSQPIVARTKDLASDLNRELGIPVFLTTLIGDEILGVLSIPDASGRSPRLKSGERIPLVPPIGAPFIAWRPESVIEKWLVRSSGGDEKLMNEWRDALLWTRKRGYQVTLRSPGSLELAALMDSLAAGQGAPNYKDQVVELLYSRERHPHQLQDIRPEMLYDVQLIAAPIFDQAGNAQFTLCLGGFSGHITGANIQIYAERLVGACVRAMHYDRYAA